MVPSWTSAQNGHLSASILGNPAGHKASHELFLQLRILKSTFAFPPPEQESHIKYSAYFSRESSSDLGAAGSLGFSEHGEAVEAFLATNEKLNLKEGMAFACLPLLSIAI